MKRFLLVLIFLVLTVPGTAETVMTDSGRVIEGRVIEVTDTYIRIVTDEGIIRLPFNRMDFDSAHYYRNYKVKPDQMNSVDDAFEEGREQEKAYRHLADQGLQLAQAGEFDKAVEFFSKAIELRQDIPQLYFFRAGVYQELGKFPEAIADYGKMISIDPEDPELYARRGWAYQLSGNPEKAIEDYSRSLALDPENIEILVERCGLYMAADKQYLALKDLDKILWLDPEAGEAYLDYAILSYRMGNHYTAWEKVYQARQRGVDIPSGFIKALGEKMSDPFVKPVNQKTSRWGFVQDIRKIVTENVGFFVAAGVAGLLAIVVLFWPSMKMRIDLKARKAEDDPEKFLRPVLFVKAAVIKRICAAMIDLIVLSALSWAAVIFLRRDIFAFVLGLLYLAKDAFGGVSIGKGMIGLRVIDEHGYRSVFFQGFLRNFTLALPIILFYVIFWTARFRVDTIVKIALVVVWGCFVFEGLMMILSRKDGRRIGDRMGGVFVHDLHPKQWRWPYFFVVFVLSAGFLAGTVIANMMLSKAFIYKLNPLRYYNIDHDFSFLMPAGWTVSSEGEGGLVLENAQAQGSFVFVVHEDAKDYALELCVKAFTQSMEDAGLVKKTEEPAHVSGLPAFKVGFVDQQSGNAILFVYFKKDRWGPLYIIQVGVPLSSMKTVMSDGMSIINSLRFE